MTASDVLSFLDLVWEQDEGWVSLPYKVDGRWREAEPFEWPAERKKVKRHVEERLRERADLYFCPLMLEEPRRKADNIRSSHWVWADLDTANPRKMSPKPSIAWQTSDGRYQGLWRLSRDVKSNDASELSRRLAYHVGADPSGWDLTQVLRPPGSFNFKYDKPFAVETLWSRKKDYTPAKLNEVLPEAPAASVLKQTTPEIPNTTAGAIIRKYRDRLPTRAFRLIKTREESVHVGERSERLWELECLLAESGLTAGEIVLVAQSTAWNKFAGRNDEITRLWMEAQKAVSQTPAVAADADSEKKQRPRFLTFEAFMAQSDIKPRWLIEEIWARESHGMIAGEPKTYKSILSTDAAVAVASGEDFLGEFRVPEPGPVIMIQEENSVAILKDRLRKIVTARGLLPPPPRRNGHSEIIIDFAAKLPIHFLNNYGFDFTDEDDREYLEDEIRAVKPVLVIFDPLYLMLGDADENSAKETRPVLQWLMHLRYTYKTGIMVVHHHRKADADRGGQRMSGTHALHAWVESALYTTLDEETGIIEVEREQRSFAKRLPLKLQFQLEDPGKMGYEISIGEMDSREVQVKMLRSQLAQDNKLTLAEVMELLKIRRRAAERLLDSLGDIVKIGGKGMKTSYGLK